MATKAGLAYTSTAEALNFAGLAKFFPLRETNQILKDLPMHVMVYYVIAMTIFMGLPYKEVMEELLDGWNGLLKKKSKCKSPAKSSICRARIKLGVEPLKQIHDQFVKPVATRRTKGAWFKRWLTVAIDGSSLNVVDTPESEAEFGRPNSSRGKSAYQK